MIMDQELDQRSRACWHGLAAQSQRQQAVSLQQVALRNARALRDGVDEEAEAERPRRQLGLF
jgi:hypothetical protein